MAQGNKVLFFLIFCCLCSKTTFAQDITCVDTVHSKVYFFRTVYLIKGIPRKSTDLSCYIPQPGKNINQIYFRGRYSTKDTIKFLTNTPKINEFLAKRFAQSTCKSLMESGILIDSLIRPKFYYKVKNRRKIGDNAKIGFSTVTATWLHLKVVDNIATLYFNNPYSLDDPNVVPKYYDIYIPLRIKRINNSVTVSRNRINERN